MKLIQLMKNDPTLIYCGIVSFILTVAMISVGIQLEISVCNRLNGVPGVVNNLDSRVSVIEDKLGIGHE